MDNVINIVNQILEDEFEIEANLLKPESQLNEDLGLDSLDAVDLIVMVDKKLGVRIEEEDARLIKTLDDVYSTIYGLLSTLKAS